MNNHATETFSPAGQKRDAMLMLVLAAAVLAVFGIVSRAELVHWDDNINIYENPHLKGLGPAQLGWMFTDFAYVRRYMPLGWLNYAVSNQVGGLNPMPFHLMNLLLHLANTLLVFVLARTLLRWATGRQADSPEAGAVSWAAAGGAFLWALHPLRTEVVAWASSAIYGQATLFMLLAVLAYLRGQDQSESTSRRRTMVWLAVAAFAASLLTYPIALFGPAVFIALDFYPLRRLGAAPRQWIHPEARRVWIEKAPFIIASGAVLAITLWSRTHAGVWEKPATLDQFGPISRLMQALYVWAYYLWKPWWPADLCPTYTTLLSFQPGSWPFVLSGLGVAALALAALLVRQRWPALAALVFCHFALLVPLVGLTEHPHYAYDRYSYLQGILWALLTAAVIWKCRQPVALRAAAWGVAAALVVLCAGLSVRQAGPWQNTFRLYEHILAKVGDHPVRSRYELVLGVHHLRRGQLDRAAEVFRDAVRADPKLADAHFNLGAVLAEQQKPAQAIESYRRVLQCAPNHVDARLNLALVLADMGKLEEAKDLLQEAVQLDPANAIAHHNLAILLNKLGKTDLAQAHLAKARELRPPQK